jgi:hypothetical protein
MPPRAYPVPVPNAVNTDVMRLRRTASTELSDDALDIFNFHDTLSLRMFPHERGPHLQGSWQHFRACV